MASILLRSNFLSAGEKIAATPTESMQITPPNTAAGTVLYLVYLDHQKALPSFPEGLADHSHSGAGSEDCGIPQAEVIHFFRPVSPGIDRILMFEQV